MIAPGDSIDSGDAMRRSLHRSHQARAQFLGAAIVVSFFVTVLGASVFLGAVMVVGTMHTDVSTGGLTAHGRTARIARPLSNGILCHYVVFDNKTAQTVEDRIGRCDEGKPKADKPPTFSWGK